MKVSRFGLELRQLDNTHLQDLRKWRNRAEVRSQMEFAEHISEEAQKHWFSQLKPEENLYFTYHEQGHVQGMVHLKNIDLNRSHAEAGIIHGNPETEGTTLPLRAILVLMEFAFDVLGLQRLHAKIRNGNTAVEKMNRQLGYRMTAGEENKAFRCYSVDKTAFADATQKFRKTMANIHGSSFELIGAAYFSNQRK